MLTNSVGFFAIHKYITRKNFNVCPRRAALQGAHVCVSLLWRKSISRKQLYYISSSCDPVYTGLSRKTVSKCVPYLQDRTKQFEHVLAICCRLL